MPKKIQGNTNQGETNHNETNNENEIPKKDLRMNFNKLLLNCSKSHNFSNIGDLTKNNVQKLEKEYDNSFDDIHKFRKIFTKRELEQIDTIIFHDENNDGIFSCAIVYHFLKECMKNNGKERPLTVIAAKPGKLQINETIFKGKKAIILDISFPAEMLRKIIEYSDYLILIDDHAKRLSNKNTDKIFNGHGHAACAYTWKFFYPKEEVPKIIQFIDNADAKLFLKHIPHGYSHFFSESIGFRYSHNKSKEMQIKKRDGRLFLELWDILLDSVPNYWIMLGYYYDEVTDNLKEQIAINAVKIDFQGYKVGVLNFSSPKLTHVVCRQIISNFRNKGEHIDFALCWAYEHINGVYRIQIMDDHVQTKINLEEIAKKLGEIGGTVKAGGGHPHIGNFYWPKNDKHDIWELFTKKFI
jgi:hypothetical protein